MLISVEDLIEASHGDLEVEARIRKAMRSLVDELNSAGLGHEVRLIHLDLVDYLEFIPDKNEEN